MRGALALVVALAGHMGSSTLGAQATRATPGAIMNGKVVVRVHVVLRDDVTPYYPVSGLELRFFRNASDSAIAVTDAAGTVTALLTAGEYRLVSARDAVWKGSRYSWSVPLSVKPGMPAIDLREPLSPTGTAAVVAAEESTPTTVPATTSARPAGVPQSTAQYNPRYLEVRQGFWIGLGLGAGSAGCEGCDGRLTGLSGNFALGGTLSRNVLLGAFFNGWTKSLDGVTLTGGTLTGGIRVYPNPLNDFFFTGGLGIATIELEVGGFSETSDVGAGAMLGFGYDIPVGRSISVTPFLNGVGISINGSTANFVQMGFGIIWH
jgi:hypothetical protein